MAKLLHKNTAKNQAIITETLRKKKVTLKPPYPKSLSGLEALQLAHKLIVGGSFHDALEISHVLLKNFPNIIDVFLVNLDALLHLERLAEAHNIVTFLFSKAPDNLGTIQNKARLHMLCNESKLATACIKRGLKISKNNPVLLEMLADCYQQQGEQEKAKAVYQKVLKQATHSNSVAVIQQTIVELSSYSAIDERYKGLIANELKNTAVVENFPLAFAMAKSSRSDKNTAAEIQWLKTANNMMSTFEEKNGKRWNLSEIQKRSERIKSLFDRHIPVWAEGYNACASESPIFIMAMPRSGTTLLEQILGAHSQISQTGESRGLINAVEIEMASIGQQHAGFPKAIKNLAHSNLNSIAKNYLLHESFLTNNSRFVNKSLLNHLFAGIAGLLFPKAKFIYLRRERLDNCLSIYQNCITNATYSTDVMNILQAQEALENLASHWQEVYPDRCYTLNYEDLASSGKVELTQLLEFLDLEWEEQILNFHTRKNLVRTPSVNQVRRALNSNAINKWKGYEPLLEGAIDYLQK